MNIDEVKAFLATEEGQTLLAPMIDEAKTPLVSKRDELLSELSGLKQTVAKYKELGDADTLAEQLAEVKKLQKNEVKPDANLEALEAHLRQEIAQEKTKFDTFKSKYVANSLNSDINDSLMKAKGVPELLRPVIERRLKASFNDDNGDVSYEALNKDGSPMFKNGNPATIGDIIDELRADSVYSRAFDSTGASGAGGRNGDAGRVTTVVTDRDDPNYSVSAHMAHIARSKK